MCAFLRWYAPENHPEELQHFAAHAIHMQKTLHVLDVFGVSKRMTQAFERVHLSGFSYDIKLSKSHDITSESGFKLLLKAAMQILGDQSFLKIHF